MHRNIAVHIYKERVCNLEELIRFFNKYLGAKDHGKY